VLARLERSQVGTSDLPRQWHAAFAKGGGRAEFHMVPPIGKNGHVLIDHVQVWRPVMDTYLAKLGFPPVSRGNK
jgi:hypothetical protein